MIDPQELAEVAYFGEDRAVEVREDVSSERVVDGDVQQVEGIEYKLGPPCNVSAVFQAIEDHEDTVVMGASLNDRGMLCVFCPYRREFSGQLFDHRSGNDMP